MYYGARYYNARIGRFTQADPVVNDPSRKEFAQALMNPQLLNAYTYVGNNPHKYVDPSGEFVIPVAIIIGAAVFAGVFLEDIKSAHAPALYCPADAEEKSIGELVVPGYDDLSTWQQEGIKFTPLVLGGVKGLAREGLEEGLEKGVKRLVINQADDVLLLGTRRQNLLHGVENGKLRNIIGDLYRVLKPGAKVIGDGGAIDAFRHTLKTGELVGGTDHLTKIKGVFNRLNKLLKNNLSKTDKEKAESLLNNIKDALKGGVGK